MTEPTDSNSPLPSYQQQQVQQLADSQQAEVDSKGARTRLTPADLEATVLAEQYYQFPGTTLTVCALTLQNGYIVTGTSACIDPRQFDEGIGKNVAREDAINKIWQLEGYLLKQTLWMQQTLSVDHYKDDTQS